MKSSKTGYTVVYAQFKKDKKYKTNNILGKNMKWLTGLSIVKFD
jgi:hypothetical protein